MLDKATDRLFIYKPALITNPRIKRLVQLSSDQPQFDDRYYHQIEIMDENRLLTSEVCGQLPIVYSNVIDDSNYSLVYADGQLIEVVELATRQVVFRNYSRSFIYFYRKVPKIDPKTPLPNGRIMGVLEWLTAVATTPKSRDLIPLCRSNTTLDLYERLHKYFTPTETNYECLDSHSLFRNIYINDKYLSKYILENRLKHPRRRVPVYTDWLMKASGRSQLDAYLVHADMSRLIFLLDRYGVRFHYARF